MSPARAAQQKASLLQHLERLPPVITSLVAICCMIGGVFVAFSDLRSKDAAHDEHLRKIDLVIERGITKREADHDILVSMVQDIKWIREQLERTRKAGYN